MKISRIQLRQMIREVMSELEEDALFSRPDVSGLQPERDIPGQTPSPICKKCQMSHPGESCPLSDESGRNLSYSHPDAIDGEGRMSRSQLYKVANYAQSLHDTLRDEDDLPEWIQSKIAVMDHDMGKVKHYLDYKIRRMKK